MWNKMKQVLDTHDCKHEKVEQTGFFETAPLNDGHWTFFAIMRCKDCRKIIGFPHENFEDACKNGTKETKSKLRKIGAIIGEESDAEYNPSSRFEDDE